jgi:hypothetical protein
MKCILKRMLVCILCIPLFITCNTIQSENKSPASDQLADNNVPPNNQPGEYKANDTVGQAGNSVVRTSGRDLGNEWAKKKIKTASLNMEVKEYKDFAVGLREVINKSGGYIAKEEQSQSAYKMENTVEIKIPVDQFDQVVNSLASLAFKLNERKIESEDVTAAVVDTRSRLESKKQVRLKYLDLLKQAKNMSEILQVQKEIDDIQEEIEAASGRINYLAHAAALSTIRLTYFQVLNPGAIGNDGPSYGMRLLNSWKSGATWMGELVIGLLSVWPLFILFFWDGC